MKTIHFIGAGPGDPELLTVKGRRLIDEADIIIYAGSLVNPQVLSGARQEAQIYDSARMTLQEVVEVMRAGVQAGKQVGRRKISRTTSRNRRLVFSSIIRRRSSWI